MESKQREHDRLLAKNNAYVSLGSGFIKVGAMKDISKGGASFEYIFFEDFDKKLSQQVDIFISQNGFHLTNLPCDVVYDIPLPLQNQNQIYAKPFIVKRCGIRFKSLTEYQTSQIISFLEKHTLGSIS